MSMSVPSGKSPHAAAPMFSSIDSMRLRSDPVWTLVLAMRMGMPNISPKTSQYASMFFFENAWGTHLSSSPRSRGFPTSTHHFE